MTFFSLSRNAEMQYTMGSLCIIFLPSTSCLVMLQIQSLQQMEQLEETYPFLLLIVSLPVTDKLTCFFHPASHLIFTKMLKTCNRKKLMV